MPVGVLLPGRRCDLCGALLLFSAVATPTGGMFCASHTDLPNCQMCSAPFRGDGRFCEQCAGSCVNTQDQVRHALPRLRELLHAMGVRLHPAVHVQLVDASQMPSRDANELGMVAGLTMVRGQQVTELYIVAGLPEMEFGATVAHESMHAWLVQNGFPRLVPKIEEGLCQVISYRIMRDMADPRAETVRKKIDLHPDPVYGDGFRLVKESVRKHGMNAVLEAVKATGRLP